MKVRRILISLAAVAFATAACTSPQDGGLGLDTAFSAEMASSWHWAGDPQRVEVGIFGSDADGIHVVSGGTIDLAFAYLGPDGSSDPQAGPSATASYVPVPGTAAAGSEPGVVSGARGIYEADGVVFDQPGLWQVAVTAAIEGDSRRLTATFPVTQTSPIPAPGDRALRTENLTIDSKGVPAGAIDSMAVNGGEIPDPELHQWTIAQALKEKRPVLVLFGTPAFCTSKMCGPEVQELQRLAHAYPDRAVFIHIELWKDFDAQVLNRAAADWLYRDDNLTDPWLYLIGADGVIVDRWGSLFDPDEVAADLEALPPMNA